MSQTYNNNGRLFTVLFARTMPFYYEAKPNNDSSPSYQQIIPLMKQLFCTHSLIIPVHFPIIKMRQSVIKCTYSQSHVFSVKLSRNLTSCQKSRPFSTVQSMTMEFCYSSYQVQCWTFKTHRKFMLCLLSLPALHHCPWSVLNDVPRSMTIIQAIEGHVNFRQTVDILCKCSPNLLHQKKTVLDWYSNPCVLVRNQRAAGFSNTSDISALGRYVIKSLAVGPEDN